MSKPEKLYGSFMVALGENTFNKVQCVASFKIKDNDGDAIYLGKKVNVLYDSFPLTFDTAFYPQYDNELDTTYFPGQHTWKIVSPEKTHLYNCLVKVYKITSEIPAMAGQNDITVQCTNLVKNDVVTLLLSGDYAETSETHLDMIAENGFFVIPKSFWQKVSGTNLTMRFNISSITNLSSDDFLTAGGKIEVTKITKDYRIELQQ